MEQRDASDSFEAATRAARVLTTDHLEKDCGTPY
jgi:hypothetical protein